MEHRHDSSGVAHALAAYTIWGILPLYWKYLSSVDFLQILSCRILFSLIFVWALLAARGNARWPRILRTAANLRSLALSTLLISVNWGVYIWAVNSGHTVQASLGYYMNPLVNVFLGLLFFNERMPRLQWVAFGLAAAGVLLLTVLSGTVPWISLTLAVSFGLYAMSKKRLRLDALEALGSETLIALPLAALILIAAQARGQGAFAGPPVRSLFLAASGIVTALPLYWFALGAKRLPLSAMGFLQFVSPTLQLAVGVFVFHEAFPARNLIAFALVWAGLAVYALAFSLKSRGGRKG